MIVLKSISQVKSFIKRNKHKEHYFNEGCGCCSSQSSIVIDEIKNRIVMKNYHESGGCITAKCDVLAVIKLK